MQSINASNPSKRKIIRSGSLGELDAMSRSEFRALALCRRYYLLSRAMRHKPDQEENFEWRISMREKTGKRADYYHYCMRYSFFKEHMPVLKDAFFNTGAFGAKLTCIFTFGESLDFLVLSGAVEYSGRNVQATAFIDPSWGFDWNSIKYIHAAPNTACSIGEHVIAASTSLSAYHANMATMLSGAYGHQAAQEPDARKEQKDPEISEFIADGASIGGGYICLKKTILAEGRSDQFGHGDHKLAGAVLKSLFSSHKQKIAQICKENGWTRILDSLGSD